MSKICELHDQAMDIMNEALQLKKLGRAHEAHAMLSRACELESESAYLVKKCSTTEPSRGMLFLGAASLAKQTFNYELAERLVCEGLSGYPTETVRQDLHQLYDEIKFERYSTIIAQNITDQEAVFRFLSGKAIGYGHIVSRLFMQRMEAFEKLFMRSIQRMYGLPFETHTKKHNHVPSYNLNMEWAPAGSFGVKIFVSYEANKQLSILEQHPGTILKDIIYNIYLVGTGEEEKIKENIGNEEYCAHFISQAKEILPDGDNVKKIGIINNNQTFLLRKTKKEINQELASKSPENKNNDIRFVSLKGYLRISDSIKNIFSIVCEDGTKTQIHVRDALEELAKKYFGDFVEIQCEKKNNGKLYLLDINAS